MQRFKTELKSPVDPQVGLIHATLHECAPAIMTQMNAFTSSRLTSPLVDWHEEVSKASDFRADAERYLYVAQCQEAVAVIMDMQVVQTLAEEGGVAI